MQIDIENVSKNTRVPSPDQMKKWLHEIAKTQLSHDAELSVRIVDEDEIRTLNRDYRNKDKTTNVLSFPMSDEVLQVNMLGDIVICAGVVESEAESANKDCRAHWAHMLVHGFLHLLGYDHMTDQDAERMESLETEILEQLGFESPYQS